MLGVNNRTLLQVLEYLVMREILTSELINGGPPCPGMERLEIVMLTSSHFLTYNVELCGNLNLLRYAIEVFSFFLMVPYIV